MNWLNIIVASTNIAALAPIYASKNDLLTCFAIILAASASFVSHLFETHKHGMFGFNCLPKNSFLLPCPKPKKTPCSSWKPIAH